MAKVSETNPHIKTASARAELAIRAVVSSVACEGVKVKSNSLKKAAAKPKK